MLTECPNELQVCHLGMKRDDPLDLFEDAPDGPDSKLAESMQRELVQMEGAIAFWKLRCTIQKEEALLKDLASMNFEVSLVRRALGASCPVNLFKDLKECFKDFATTMHIATSWDPLE